MVLATVVGTQGSTYSKAGAQMLIAGDDYQGLLSGGCLEGDLTLHAARCLAEGRPRLVSYDMRDRDEDEMWGLGLGCDGALDILLQPLSAAQGYLPFAPLAEAAAQGRRATLALVVSSPPHGPAPGSALVLAGSERHCFGLTAPQAEVLRSHCEAALAGPRTGRLAVTLGAAGDETTPAAPEAPSDVLVTALRPPPRLLVLGAGPDTVPLLRMARELGWYVTQADHRPASLAAAAGAAPVDASVELAPGTFGDAFDPDTFDAVVVMTHHLQSDRAWLTALAGRAVPYIGLLGPAARRRRLLGDVTAALEAQGTETARHDARSLAPRTHGPVGLDLGARDPAGIALSILAEIQQFLARNVQ